MPDDRLLKFAAWNRRRFIWKQSGVLFLHFDSWNERVSHVQMECAFYFHLSHGLKSNVRHKRPDLTSTQEREPLTGYRESLTWTRNDSQYTIKQHNNLLAKRNLVGQRSTSVIEKKVNSIVSGPCYGKPFLLVCWRQIHSVVSYFGFKWLSDKIIFNESVALMGKWSFSIEHVTELWSYSRPCIRLLIPIKDSDCHFWVWVLMHVISLKCLYINILVIFVKDGLFFHSKSMGFA